MVFFPRSRYTSIRATTYVKLIKEKGKNEKRSGQCVGVNEGRPRGTKVYAG